MSQPQSDDGEFLKFAKENPDASFHDFFEYKRELAAAKQKKQKVEQRQREIDSLLKQLVGQKVVSAEIQDHGNPFGEYEEYNPPIIRVRFESGLVIDFNEPHEVKAKRGDKHEQ